MEAIYVLFYFPLFFLQGTTIAGLLAKSVSSGFLDSLGLNQAFVVVFSSFKVFIAFSLIKRPTYLSSYRSVLFDILVLLSFSRIYFFIGNLIYLRSVLKLKHQSLLSSIECLHENSETLPVNRKTYFLSLKSDGKKHQVKLSLFLTHSPKCVCTLLGFVKINMVSVRKQEVAVLLQRNRTNKKDKVESFVESSEHSITPGQKENIKKFNMKKTAVVWLLYFPLVALVTHAVCKFLFRQRFNYSFQTLFLFFLMDDGWLPNVAFVLALRFFCIICFFECFFLILQKLFFCKKHPWLPMFITKNFMHCCSDKSSFSAKNTEKSKSADYKEPSKLKKTFFDLLAKQKQTTESLSSSSSITFVTKNKLFYRKALFPCLFFLLEIFSQLCYILVLNFLFQTQYLFFVFFSVELVKSLFYFLFCFLFNAKVVPTTQISEAGKNNNLACFFQFWANNEDVKWYSGLSMLHRKLSTLRSNLLTFIAKVKVQRRLSENIVFFHLEELLASCFLEAEESGFLLSSCKVSGYKRKSRISEKLRNLGFTKILLESIKESQAAIIAIIEKAFEENTLLGNNNKESSFKLTFCLHHKELIMENRKKKVLEVLKALHSVTVDIEEKLVKTNFVINKLGLISLLTNYIQTNKELIANTIDELYFKEIIKPFLLNYH